MQKLIGFLFTIISFIVISNIYKIREMIYSNSYVGYLYQTSVHEFGHTIGLLHPFLYKQDPCYKLMQKTFNSSDDFFASKIKKQGKYLPKELVNKNSVMTYSVCQGSKIKAVTQDTDIIMASMLFKKYVRGTDINIPFALNHSLHRTTKNIEVCITNKDKINLFQYLLVIDLIEYSHEQWKRSGFNIKYRREKCSYTPQEVRLRVASPPEKGNWSFIGASKKEITMQLVIPQNMKQLKGEF